MKRVKRFLKILGALLCVVAVGSVLGWVMLQFKSWWALLPIGVVVVGWCWWMAKEEP